MLSFERREFTDTQFQVFFFRVVEIKELFNCVCALFLTKRAAFLTKRTENLVMQAPSHS
jgi:hypothetical protein